jgi:hypothetical protein
MRASETWKYARLLVVSGVTGGAVLRQSMSIEHGVSKNCAMRRSTKQQFCLKFGSAREAFSEKN